MLFSFFYFYISQEFQVSHSVCCCPIAIGQAASWWSHSDGVGVRQGAVADPSLRRAGLDGRQAQEADLQPRGGDLWELEAQSNRTHLQHGGRGQARDLQLQPGHSNSVMWIWRRFGKSTICLRHTIASQQGATFISFGEFHFFGFWIGVNGSVRGSKVLLFYADCTQFSTLPNNLCIKT